MQASSRAAEEATLTRLFLLCRTQKIRTRIVLKAVNWLQCNSTLKCSNILCHILLVFILKHLLHLFFPVHNFASINLTGSHFLENSAHIKYTFYIYVILTFRASCRERVADSEREREREREKERERETVATARLERRISFEIYRFSSSRLRDDSAVGLEWGHD